MRIEIRGESLPGIGGNTMASETENTRYYRFDVGNVLIRKMGEKIEKFGQNKRWEDASRLRHRFRYGDTGLTEISEEEALGML